MIYIGLGRLRDKPAKLGFEARDEQIIIKHFKIFLEKNELILTVIKLLKTLNESFPEFI